MRLCPRVYGADMTDQANLDYCLEIQRGDRGGICRRSRCMYCEGGEQPETNTTDAERELLAPVQRRLF